MGDMSIPISVIVCTRNRLESLRRYIQSLAQVKSTYEWELMIVDNGSNDGTSEMLASLPEYIGKARLKTVYEPKRGYAVAKNAGVRQSSGKIIAFTDDDCYVDENYIDALMSSFATNPEIGFLGGRISLFDDTDSRTTIQECSEYLHLKPKTFIGAHTIQGANMAFKREVLDLIGGFSELFGAGTGVACEDTDAVAAALWAGVCGAYDPAPTVYHHHGRKTKTDLRPLFKFYEKGVGAYFTKYLLRHDSRSAYFRAWIGTSQSQLRNATSVKSYLVFGRRVFRHLSGGLHYILRRSIHRTF